MTHSVQSILGPLYGVRGSKTIERRLTRLTARLKGARLNRRQAKRAFKGNFHDHIDCSVEYSTLLDQWDKLYDFNLANFPFPEGVRGYWAAVKFDPSTLAFPQAVIDAWRCTGIEGTAAKRASKRKAVRLYRQFLLDNTSGKLFIYVQAILVHILPVMQTEEHVERIIRERVRMGVRNGEGAAELRGAPQLHTLAGTLDMEGATRAYIAGIADSPYPINLTLCALRHEDPKVAWELAKIAGKYHHCGVTVFDLAADEESNSGVLQWWMKPAVLASLFGLDLTIHLWETNEPTDDDIKRLNAFDLIVPQVRERLTSAGLAVDDVLTSAAVEASVSSIIDEVIATVLAGAVPMNVDGKHLAGRLGHGFRGHRQGSRVCEVCFSSNVVTAQVKEFGEHPGHALFHEEGALLAYATDGTTLIGIDGMLDEVMRLQKHGWDAADILVSTIVGLRASSFTQFQRTRLISACLDSFEALACEIGR
jgi:adenosine deaminase